jgi:hypothetical protein
MTSRKPNAHGRASYAATNKKPPGGGACISGLAGSKFAPTQDVGDQLDRAIRPVFPRKACTGAWVIVSASFRHQCFLAVDSFPAK